MRCRHSALLALFPILVYFCGTSNRFRDSLYNVDHRVPGQEDAEVEDTANTTLKQKNGMFLHTLEVDVPTAPDPSAPNKEVTVSELAYGAFDAEKFHRMCDSKSDDYDADFAEHLDAAQREIFQEGTLWASRQVLTSVVVAIGKRQGLVPRKDNVYIRCNRFGNPRSTT